MLNILIVEDNIIECNQLANYISKNNSNIRLYHMASTGNDALEVINQQSVDIILLNLELSDISGTEIINLLSKNNLKKYEKSIILISNESRVLLQVLKSPYVYTYFTKPINLNELSNSINELSKIKISENNKNIIFKKIDAELTTLHFNFSYNGTRYLKECIYELYIKNEFDFDNLSKNIYPIIAEKHNKSPNNIHSNIKQSIKSMYYDCEESVIQNYFHYSYFEKPKLKEIIFTILNKL